MYNDKMDTIEKEIKGKKISDYEIFLIDGQSYESIFLRDKVDIERDINDFKYYLRILTHKEDKTGIGLIKGNSLNPKEIERNIDICVSIANSNLDPKFNFPQQASFHDVVVSEKKVIQDPLNTKNNLAEELITEIKQQKEIQPTFGRIRVHIDNISLRNSNGLDLTNVKTYFFVEFSLKAQKEGKLSEYWPYLFIKDTDQLNFPERVDQWAKIAQDSLIAKLPKPKEKTIVVFSPQVLNKALNPVIENHASGKAFFQKISRFTIDQELASEEITIIDDGLLKGGLRTNGWDIEGSPRQRTEIVKNGIFQNYIYDQRYAILSNHHSTGNAIRDIKTEIIDNGISNLEILPGTMNLDEIISEINEGYYIDQFSWLNPSKLSGAFGAEIRNGYYIKNGKLEYPIRLGNISGNVIKMLGDCQFISKEREFFENSLFPYMAFNNLTVSS
ncbi:MAG: TldD/PmbA family protein [Candidatus Lokiarchaeia archaeon]|nr:TldD/PmbA family protein [Candidatus Lokiarchaeia archaeon]